MDLKTFRPILVGAAIVLGACSFPDDSLLPSLTSSDSGDGTQSADQPAARQPSAQPASARGVTAQEPPNLNDTNFQTPGVTDGRDTGTFVGQKVIELRNELRRLQADVSENNQELQAVRAETVSDSERYHSSVGAINARLQVGTTPGNPILVAQFNQAVTLLDRIGDDIDKMNVLVTEVNADATLANFLSENTRAAYRLTGAVDEDHRQLAILEDEVNRTVVLIDRLLKELTEDVQRQTNYVSTERANLNTLSAAIKSGEILGAGLTNRALTAAVGGIGAMPRASAPQAFAGRRPLVVIRFDRPDVEYEQALYTAVSRTLERRPNATFDLVAVAPAQGGTGRVALNSSQARRNAEQVMRSLQRMGLPAGRISLTARTSEAAQTNEVHLYPN